MDEQPPTQPPLQPPAEPPAQPPPAGYQPPPSESPSSPPKRQMGKGVSILVGIVAAAAGYFGVQAILNSGGGGDPPTQAEVDAAFTPLEGYEYTAFPEAALADARDQLANTPETQGEDIVIAGRLINAGAQPVAALVIMGMSPDMSDEAKDAFLGGFESTSGAEMQEVSINGETGYAGTTASGPTLVFFDSDGLVFILQGSPQVDADLLREFGTKLQTTNA